MLVESKPSIGFQNVPWADASLVASCVQQAVRVTHSQESETEDETGKGNVRSPGEGGRGRAGKTDANDSNRSGDDKSSDEPESEDLINDTGWMHEMMSEKTCTIGMTWYDVLICKSRERFNANVPTGRAVLTITSSTASTKKHWHRDWRTTSGEPRSATAVARTLFYQGKTFRTSRHSKHWDSPVTHKYAVSSCVS